MRRTTIFIPEELDRDLQIYARQKGKPVASIVREAVAAYITDGAAGPALPSFTAAFDSGHTDTASKHDEILFGTLTPHGDAGPARTRRVSASAKTARQKARKR